MENNDNDEAKQMEAAMKKAPWEVCQWGSIEFGWKYEFFYLN